MQIYHDNRANVICNAIGASRLGARVMEWFADMSVWEGTSTELLVQIETDMDDKALRAKEWPKSPAVLGKKLRMLGAFLRKVGVNIIEDRRNNKRVIRIERTGN